MLEFFPVPDENGKTVSCFESLCAEEFANCTGCSEHCNFHYSIFLAFVNGSFHLAGSIEEQVAGVECEAGIVSADVSGGAEEGDATQVTFALTGALHCHRDRPNGQKG